MFFKLVWKVQKCRIIIIDLFLPVFPWDGRHYLVWSLPHLHHHLLAPPGCDEVRADLPLWSSSQSTWSRLHDVRKTQGEIGWLVLNTILYIVRSEHVRTLFNSSQSQESKYVVFTQTFYAAMRIKAHLDNTISTPCGQIWALRRGKIRFFSSFRLGIWNHYPSKINIKTFFYFS